MTRMTEHLHWQGLGTDVQWTTEFLKLVHRCTPAQWYEALRLRDHGLTPLHAAVELRWCER